MNLPAAPLPVLSIGEYVLDESNARLTRDGKPLELPPKAFAVLCLLARNAQRLVTKDELLDSVWGHRHVSESVLKTIINQLRGELGDDPRTPHYIETLHKRGYRFVAQVSALTAARGVARAAVDGATARILAVDDEPELLSMIKDYLLARGFDVLTAANAQEARSILASQQIALVLLDITLPG